MKKSVRRISGWRKLLIGVAAFFLLSFATLCCLTGSPSNAIKLLMLGVGYVHDSVVQAPAFKGRPQVNILMIGTDVSFGACSRTDSIKVISVDVPNQRLAILSVPRDIWITLPDGNHGRINSAYSEGGRDSFKATRNVQQTVASLLTGIDGHEVHIDYYIRMQIDRFVGLIDAIGGVDINVEKKMVMSQSVWISLYHLYRPRQLRLSGKAYFDVPSPPAIVPYSGGAATAYRPFAPLHSPTSFWQGISRVRRCFPSPVRSVRSSGAHVGRRATRAPDT